MKRVWSRSLSGQFIGVVLLSVALAQVVSLLVFRYESARRLRSVLRDEFLGRAASAYRVAQSTPPATRTETLQNVSTPLARYWITSATPGTVSDWQKDARERLVRHLPAEGHKWATRNLFDGEPMLAVASKSVWETFPGGLWPLGVPLQLAEIPEWNGFGLAVKLDDGTWLNAVYSKPDYLVRTPTSATYYVALAGVVVLFSAGAWLTARRISRPLRQLARATERLGRGEDVEPLPVEGPDDIRCTVTTFNRMQVRLRRFVEDRTQMLAAIGHDLRTPITSLRLRAEFVDDPETREKLLATIDEMQAMTEATLAFARSDAAAENTRVVDMSALIGSLCDDLGELGWKVEFTGNGRVPCSCRPDAIRRAMRNIVENAVRYGERARVSLHAPNGSVDIFVDDDGPGIAVAEREKVFTPFVRLETSRNRNTGGVGLGLAIARSILRNHGGDIVLLDGSPGLRVHLHLPRD